MNTFKKILLFIFFFSLFEIKTNAQELNEKEKIILSQFIENFNNDNYKEIFDTFSEDFQNAFPYKNLQTFLNELRELLGVIQQWKYEDQQPGFSLFTINFHNGIRSLVLGTDGNSKITGFWIVPFINPKVTRNKTNYILPFYGEWYTFWGGDTEGQNYHIISNAQRNAFDFVIEKEKQRFKTDDRKTEDYYAFGQKIIAPCAGEVIIAVDGIKDNIIGEWNEEEPFGNFVMLLTETKEYIVLAHLKQFSVKVKNGDRVEQGQEIGLCGNSGRSSEPHLHFHIQDKENFEEATGIKCYFENIYVNGDLKTDYSPVQKDMVGNK